MTHDHSSHNHHMMSNVHKTMNHAEHMMGIQTNNSSASTITGHSSHHDMMSMAMTFHGGFKEKILFDQWNTQSVAAFVGSWFVIFFIAIIYEGLKTIRDYLAKRDQRCKCAEQTQRPGALLPQREQQDDRPDNNNLIQSARTTNVRSKRPRILSGHHFIQTALHILQMGISYLLMLVAMTFNVYLFLAVILGAGVGHFLFGWRRSSVIDYNEHCH